MTESLHDFFSEFISALGPLIDAANNPEELKLLLADLGWTVNSIPKPLQDLAASGSKLVEIIGSEPESISAEQMLEAIELFVNAINAIRTKPDNDFPAELDIATFKATIGRDLLDYVLIEHLLRNRHQIGGLLKLAGFIRLVEMPASGIRQSYIRREVAWSQIGTLLKDPAKGFREVFDWNSATPKLADALSNLSSVLESHGLLLSYFEAKADLLTFVNSNAIVPTNEPFGIDLALDKSMGAPDDFSAGVQLLLLPPTANRGAVIALLPYAQLKGVQEILLSDTLSFLIKGNADLTKGVAIIIPPGLPLEVHFGFLGGGTVHQAEFQIGLKTRPLPNQAERLLIGTPDATRLSFESATFFLGVQMVSSEHLDVFLSIEIDNARVVIKPALGEADSFLARLMGDKDLSAKFSFGLRFSSLSGFHLTGSGGLEVDFPLHVNLGLVDFQSLFFGVKLQKQGIDIDVGATVSTELGPLVAVVEEAGFKLKMQFSDPPTGNLGPINLGFGFLPPKGAGLSVNASGITGGGFITFDEPNHRYFGGLTLNFSEIGLTAIGLIETKMPDGSEGFALIISIGITFTPPVQLSLGFTLLGVGGLIAVNRSLNIEALQAGIKNRTLDGILFPHLSTLVANAPQIVSDLQAVFPVQEGRFVVGPMVKIGWGSPTLLTADIGIFLELPDPIRIVLMGQVEATFPKPEEALVVIHLDVLGVIDFAKQELSFQASLYDSRILSYPLSGDSAFLLGWGDNPRFALSLGGFHPKFTPPPPAIIFAGLKRLTLVLGLSGKLQLACLAYLALTPNSLQFGAQVNLHVSAGPLTVDGHLGFDALFILSPFSFEVEIRGGVHLKFKGISLFGISLTLVLSGPTPWHARGKARISLLFFSISVGFSFTWGQEEKVYLPPIDPWKPFCDALKDAGNWGSLLPAGRGMVEALCSLEAEADKAIAVHPAGRLEVRQNIVPLGITLTKMGNAPISTHDRFDIESLTVGNETLTVGNKTLEPIEEFFARGQFEELTNDQKLSLPSFEKMKAGVRAAASETVHIDGQPEDKTLDYESILINPDRSSERQLSPSHFEWEDAQFIVAARVARRVEQRMGPQKRFSDLRPQPKVTVGEERYAIANTANLTRAQLAGQENHNFTRMEAEQILKAQLERQPALANQLIAIPEAEVAK